VLTKPGVRRLLEDDGIDNVTVDILDLLMRSAGRIVSRDQIAAILYQRETTPYERSVDVHVSHLRKKLEQSERSLIRTVRGVGYRVGLGHHAAAR